ncbi:MAG: DUF177 domain-containing protein [Saprospiraceae bacterium]
MGNHTEFLIPFEGLENGEHNYRFQVSTDFFENFENSRIQSGNYEVHLKFDKTDQMMILDFSFEGYYHSSCDRCLTMINIPTSGTEQVIVKLLSTTSENENEAVVVIEDDAHQIDVAPFISDMINLNLPLVNERDCDAENYKFCDHTVLDEIGGDRNDTSKSDDNISESWDVLKKLKFD